MEKSLPKDLLYGRQFRVKMASGDIEYQRKVTLLIILNYLAIAMLTVFACMAIVRGDHVHATINSVTLALVLLGFFLMRRRGNLLISSYIIVTLLCLEFLSDIRSDTFRSMWSFTIPVICFFLLGIRHAIICIFIFLVLAVSEMLFEPARSFPVDFKIRFFAIFFCVAFFGYFFELVRQQTQRMLQKSQFHARVQRDIALALSSEEQPHRALDRVLEFILRLETIDSGGIYFVDRQTGALTLVANRGLTAEFVNDVQSYPPESPNVLLVRKGVPLYSKYRDLGLPINMPGKQEQLRAIAVLPVKFEGRVIAVMNLASHSHDEMPVEIRTELESIALNISNAIGRLIAIRDLHELSSRNDAILAAVPNIIMQVDAQKVYTWANKAGIAFFGDDVIGKRADHYFVGEQQTYQNVEPVFFGSEEIIYVESWQLRKDGEKRLLAWWCRSLKDDTGAVVGALSSARDITDSRLLEEQLRQTQKMEAIGQLAGGLAHDFHNQLSVISGFAELIRDKTVDNATISHYADNILVTARRSADLTGQLLAFSRKGKFLAAPLDVHKIIGEVVDMLRHTIDKRIVIRQRLEAAPSTIIGDSAQIQNALLNIALNARDAMPDGGELSFSTEPVRLDKNYSDPKKYSIALGQYIMIQVTDTGLGMDEETRSHLFEPFFTTKAQGKGTGMGLPAVYGIVKSHHGVINVYSEPGRGTAVKIYLPASETEAGGEAAAEKPRTAGKKLSILFVDDEDLMREMAQDILEDFGHSVTLAENGQAAIELYRERWQSIDLVILDIIMPVLGGRAAFAALRSINPYARIILSSGYSINEEVQQIIDQGALGFVQKPFSLAQLSEAIHHAMEAQPSGAPSVIP